MLLMALTTVRLNNMKKGTFVFNLLRVKPTRRTKGSCFYRSSAGNVHHLVDSYKLKKEGAQERISPMGT
jgi:hypothetical protein